MNQFVRCNFLLVTLFILIHPARVLSEDVIFMPQWILNDQHAGEIYASEEWNKSGSESKLVLLPYDEVKDQFKEVLLGHVHISTSEVITLLQKIDATHSDIVILALKEQISPAGYLSLKNKNIVKPKDMEGKVFGFYTENTLNHLRWFCDFHGIDYSQIKLKKITSDNLAPLMDGIVDIIVAHDTNEPIVLKKIGYDTHFIPMYGPSSSYYGSAYFTSRTFYEGHKKAIYDFVKKVSEGWKWSIENPEKAADLVMKYYPKDRYILNSYTHTRDKVVKGINVRAFHLTHNVGINCIGCFSEMQWNVEIDGLIEGKLIKDSEFIRRIAAFDVTRRVFSSGVNVYENKP